MLRTLCRHSSVNRCKTLGPKCNRRAAHFNCEYLSGDNNKGAYHMWPLLQVKRIKKNSLSYCCTVRLTFNQSLHQITQYILTFHLFATHINLPCLWSKLKRKKIVCLRVVLPQLFFKTGHFNILFFIHRLLFKSLHCHKTQSGVMMCE